MPIVRTSWKAYAAAAVFAGLALALRAILGPLLGAQDLYITFFFAVGVAAWASGWWPSVVAVLISALGAWYWFVPKTASGSPQTIVSLALFVVTALAVAAIIHGLQRARQKSEELLEEGRRREAMLEETIAARLRAEGAIAEQLNWFTVTLQSIAEAVVTTDEQGRIALLNPTAEQMTGWTSAEAKGHPLEDILRLLDLRTRAPLESPVKKSAAWTGPSQALPDSVLLVGRDGTEHPVAVSAASIRAHRAKAGGAVLVFRDVGEALRSRAALEESEARFRVMADSAPALIWMSDADGRAVYFNEQWLKFTGRTLEQELRCGRTADIHPDDRQRCLDLYRASFEAKMPFETEYRLRRAGGQYRWLVDKAVPRYDGTGQFVGYIGACLDITERKAAEHRLKEEDRRKDDFLAILSHELRNPLAPIRNAAHLIRMLDPRTDRRLAEACAMLERQTSHLARLVDELLDVSRIMRGKITLNWDVIDVASVFSRAVEQVRPLLDERKQKLAATLPAGPAFVHGDLTRLVQAVTNVLHNASKFSDNGATIELSAAAADSGVEIKVRDAGRGIDPEFLPRVFDLFHQEDNVASGGNRGLGVGLALVRDLIGLHGGTVSARSEGRGKGSEFTICLPAVSGKKNATEAPREKGSAVGQAMRVLIVDDNADAANSLAALLGIRGHSVKVVCDSTQAVNEAESFAPRFVVLDIGMPGLNGYELAARLQQNSRTQRATLIAVTGYAQFADRQRSEEAGISYHFVKPVDFDRFIALIEARSETVHA